MMKLPSLVHDDVTLPDVSFWSTARMPAGSLTHIKRYSQAMGVRLRAGSLPKKVTEVMKEMPKMMSTMVVSVPMVMNPRPSGRSEASSM
jgi:hypothetical protein